MTRFGPLAAALIAIATAAFATTAALATTAHAADSALPIELNKLEPLPAAGSTPAGCRVYFVVNNNDPDTITQLQLDLILFGTDGVIARRVALNLGPLPGKKTGVRLFDLTGQPCDGIGRVLINDVLACQSAPSAAAPAAATAAPAPSAPASSAAITPAPAAVAGPGSASACLDRLTPTSRIAAVTFGK